MPLTGTPTKASQHNFVKQGNTPHHRWRECRNEDPVLEEMRNRRHRRGTENRRLELVKGAPSLLHPKVEVSIGTTSATHHDTNTSGSLPHWSAWNDMAFNLNALGGRSSERPSCFVCLQSSKLDLRGILMLRMLLLRITMTYDGF
jgi:hypothetical protein